MSTNKLHELLKISIDTDPKQSDDDQYSLIISEGLKDFLDIEVGDIKTQSGSCRVKYSAPSRLIKKILSRCRKGGMSRSDFGIAYRAVTSVKKKREKSLEIQLYETLNFYNDIVKFKLLIDKKSVVISERKWLDENFDTYSKFNDKGRSWSLYYVNCQQMEMTNLYCFVLLARELKWLDIRKCPSTPHPSELKWGSIRSANMDSTLRRWRHYERPFETDEFLERIDVVGSVYLLIEKKAEISFSSVYDAFIFEKPFRDRHELALGKASASQILRRFGDGKSFEFRFLNGDDESIIKVLFDVNDSTMISEKKDIAKFRRGGREIDKRKLIPKDKTSGQFKKS